MWTQIAQAIPSIGVAWVQKLLNKQPQNVSAYFSGNGEYANNVMAQQGRIKDLFAKYASHLPEGSPEANEFVQIATPALSWQGQRNSSMVLGYADLFNSEGQRLVSQYEEKSLLAKAGDTINKVTDPIKEFFSLFSLNYGETEEAILGVPKTDTVIPIFLTQDPAQITVEQPAISIEQPAISIEQPAITVEQKEAETEKTGFEKFALPVGIAVISGVVLLMLRR